MRARLRVRLEFEEMAGEGATQVEEGEIREAMDGAFELFLSERESASIDELELAVLRLQYEASRQVLARHLTQFAQKKARRAAGSGRVVCNPTPYRVDGELGRYAFATYRVEDEAGQVVYDTAKEVFAPLHGKQLYRTRGWKQLALVRGAVQGSYRETASWLNRVRHQPGATRMRTLAEVVEAEGVAVAASMEAAADAALREAGFSAEGAPLTPLTGMPRVGPKLSPRTVERAVAGLEIDQTLRQQAASNAIAYEDPAATVYLSIDDVWVHHQKDHRSVEAPEGAKTEQASFVHTTVAHVATSAGSRVLSGESAPSVLRLVVAFLIANGLVRRPLVVFVDGQRTLHAALATAFAWMGAMRIILDWYHLVKKCGVALSLALKGKQARNEVLARISHLLWYGLVDEAIGALRAVPRQQIKNEKALEVLVAYLERVRSIVPCYAARKRLGLRTSSNVGEKHNDLVVSSRQKRKGMSWSPTGSHALAAITTLVRNGQHEQWITDREVDLRMAA